MRILLIDPPFYRFIGYYNRYFPLGLAYLAAVLRGAGHEILIYDADCNVGSSRMDFARLENSYPLYLKSLRDDGHPVWQEMKSRIQDFNPDMVGISVWTTFAASAFKIASIVKQLDKSLPIIMGGPHVSIKSDEMMRICPEVDYLVRGEGEETFLELAETVWRESTSESLRNIKGISYRDKGQAVHNPKAEFIKNLDSIPFPARDLLVNKDSYNSEDMGLLMTSRGCPYNCSYCATSIWGRKIRCRSVDNIIEEIKSVIDMYGTIQFTFKDDSFTINRRRVMELCNRLIEENLKINWECNTRVNLVDEELLKKMKAAGCNSIKVGIETGSERLLKLINKKTTLSQSKRAAELFRKVGIYWTGYFMIGLPSETREDVYQTLSFMKELGPDYASISVYEPFPGTDLFEVGLEKGLVQGERSLEDFYAISPKYYYVKDIDRRVDTMDGEEFEKLEIDIKHEFHRYNRRIPRLAKRVSSRIKLYIHSPRLLWGDFKKFISWL